MALSKVLECHHDFSFTSVSFDIAVQNWAATEISHTSLTRLCLYLLIEVCWMNTLNWGSYF